MPRSGKGFDLVLAPSPPLTIGVGAWLIGLMRRAPFVYNVQEIYPDVAIRLGVLRNRSLIRLMYWLERFTYRRARRVVVISERFRRDLLAKGVPAEKLVVIPNFVDTDFIQPLPRHNRFSALHGLDDRFVVLYAGNLGLTQGWETVLQAAASLAVRPDVRFLLVGDGARRAWLENEVAARGLPNVTLLPYQPRSVVPEMYAASDVCLVPLKGGTARDTFPSKIYTIMAAGRPAIACADEDSELAWVVREARCGVAIPPDDAGALAAAVIGALDARPGPRRHGPAGARVRGLQPLSRRGRGPLRCADPRGRRRRGAVGGRPASRRSSRAGHRGHGHGRPEGAGCAFARPVLPFGRCRTRLLSPVPYPRTSRCGPERSVTRRRSATRPKA